MSCQLLLQIREGLRIALYALGDGRRWLVIGFYGMGTGDFFRNIIKSGLNDLFLFMGILFAYKIKKYFGS